jgi:hypothetical protein
MKRQKDERSGRAHGGYWSRLTDEELKRITFKNTDPETTVKNLVLEVPVSDEEPIVEQLYDFRRTKRALIRCAHCRYPNHLLGFVIRVGDQRFLCGHNCGEKIYGADFHYVLNDFTQVKERAELLHRVGNLNQALPNLLAYLSALRADPAFDLYSATRQELIRRMPRLRGALRIAIEREQGNLFIDAPVRDYIAERRDEDRYEREMVEWKDQTVAKRKQLRREGYRKPDKPKKPLWTTERRQIGAIPVMTLFSVEASPKQMVMDIVPQFENLADRPVDHMAQTERAYYFAYQGKDDWKNSLNRAELTGAGYSNMQLATIFRQIALLLDRIEQQIDRLQELKAFFEPARLALVAKWATENKLAGLYTAVGNSLTIENEDGLQHTVSLPTGYAVPGKAAIRLFKEAVNRAL